MAPPTRRELAAWVAFAAALAVALYVGVPPISRDQSHWGRMWLAVAGAVSALAVAAVGVRASPGGARLVRGGMVALCVVGWFNYYQFDRRIFVGIDDYTDITYYYLNSKYLDELGFYGFYAAMIVADQETNDRHTHTLRQYRDLRDDQVKPIDVALAHGKELETTRFTPEEWRAFQQDNDWFLARISNEAMRTNFYVDHGYNPPPTWSILGGLIAEAVPVTHLKAIAAIDGVLVVALFGAVYWAFGFEAMLLAMVFFLSTFSGRWPVLGQALLRFDWLAALVGGMACLRRGRFGWAGGLLAYAALNRVFPAIFLGAWLWTLLGDLWRTRRVAARHLRFAAAALAVVGVLTGGALARYGVENFRESAANLAMHNRSFSSHRVGLGGLLVYGGETTRAEINAHGGMALREQRVQAWIPTLRVIGVALIGLVAAAAIRSRREAWETLPWLILPFFALTNPQVNYYNLRLVAVVWHAAHLAAPHDPSPAGDRWFHRIALVLLFGVDVAAQWTKVQGWDRHATNSVGSIGMAVYLTAVLGWVVAEGVRGWRPASRVHRLEVESP